MFVCNDSIPFPFCLLSFWKLPFQLSIIIKDEMGIDEWESRPNGIRQNGIVDEMGIDKMGVDKMGGQNGSRRSGMIPCTTQKHSLP